MVFIEHFQKKWTPVFRLEMRRNKELGVFSIRGKAKSPCEGGPGFEGRTSVMTEQSLLKFSIAVTVLLALFGIG
ncbi:hypothetical protein JS562_53375, partial [Agrobacterium sp. S2]|nr:hypothetical protein [Agrobacterium sp. S2]